MDFFDTMGFRSPSMNALAGQSSPGQGRSLREYEEQMSALRKENFNLKLRIYFLEENAGIGGNTSGGGVVGSGPGIGHGSPPDGSVAPESLFKQNIDLKVEVESLRKDLQEKQDLLCQAAKAMEMMEESQRKTEHHHQEVLSDMEHRLEMLQQEIKQLEAADRQHQHQEPHLGSNATRSVLNDTNLLDILEKQHLEMNVVDKLQVLDMENLIRQCRTQNEELCRRISDLNKQLEEKEHKMNAVEVQLSEMRYECAEMKDKLEENDRSTLDAEQMSKLLQNAMNVKEERIMHLHLEVKVLKALNDNLNERNYRLEDDNCKQLQIINDQTRLIQEMSDIIAMKSASQYGYNQYASKFKKERNKLLAEIEQLRMQVSSVPSRIRPKSMPASAIGMEYSSRQKLRLEVCPSSCVPPTAAKRTATYDWGLHLSKSQTCLGSSRLSSPQSSKLSFWKKSGSEPEISCLGKYGERSFSSISKDWPVPSKPTKNAYFDRIKGLIADITKIGN